jgi:hypothetical protein
MISAVTPARFLGSRIAIVDRRHSIEMVPEWWCLQSGATPKIIQNLIAFPFFSPELAMIWGSHMLRNTF